MRESCNPGIHIPREQVTVLEKLVNRKLPVTQHAIDVTSQIMLVNHLPDGWLVYGKTGTAYPRNADESFSKARAYGWYVGRATKGGQTLAFVRLIQDEKEESESTGQRARNAFLSEFPTLVDALKLQKPSPIETRETDSHRP